jgi:hypothetical protein
MSSNTFLFLIAGFMGGILMSCSAEAQEAQSLVADGFAGSTITIHQDKGQCVGDAKRAEWVSKDGQQKVPGCWIIVPGSQVQVVYFDGDAMRAPMSAFRPAKVM